MEEHKIELETGEKYIDFKQYLHRSITLWYLFPISIAFCLAIAYFQFKSTVPIYKLQASILIKDNQKAFNINDIDINNLLEFTQIDEKRVNAEKSIFQSYRLNFIVSKRLDDNIRIFKEGRYMDKQLYPEKPFNISIDHNHRQLLDTKIELKPINDNSFQLIINNDNPRTIHFKKDCIEPLNKNIAFSNTFNYGDTIYLEYLKVCIEKTPTLVSSDEGYYFIIYDIESIAKSFIANTKFESNTESNVIIITHETSNIQRGIEYLNMLIYVYLENSVSKNKEIAQKTINFISNEIACISDSLEKAEEKLKNYQSKESLMNLDIITESTYSKLDELQSSKAKLIVELRYFDYLKKYLKANENMDKLLAPTSMGVDDQFLTNLINKLSELNAEKSDLEANSVKDNPYLIGLNKKIEELKSSITESVSNIENQHKIEIQDLDKRLGKLTSKVKQLPYKQRVLFNYERKFDLYDEVFNMLLKKQSEIKISKASMIPLHEVVDYARLKKTMPIKPQKRKILITALLMGLILPIIIIISKDLISDRITVYDDIEKLTNYPIIGYILHKKEHEENIIYNHPKSLASESFRSVRANFQFISKKKETTTALITSAGPGAGKSFISLNIASSFAINNKKTVLVSFDLRKPNYYAYQDLKNKHGVSSYLSEQASINQVIFNTEIPNLDIIPVGAIPYNPAELIANDNTAKLFEELKNKYDCIVIDTPPLGVVADAFLLIDFADIIITVVRNNRTKKKMLRLLLKNMKQNQIKNNNILVNDIKKSRNGYGYYSGYYSNYYQ